MNTDGHGCGYNQNMSPEEAKFLFEVERFRLWTVTAVKQTGEWQSDYPEWESVYEATEAFLGAVDIKAVSKATVDELLYILDSDNEMWAIADAIAEYPEVMVYLAQAAIDSNYFWAKSQLAEKLVDSAVNRSEVERLLFALAKDEREYIRRIALGNLAKINSPLVNELIEPAWASNNLVQRMMVLSALLKISSPELEKYLALAEADGRKHLVSFAARIRRGESV